MYRNNHKILNGNLSIYDKVVIHQIINTTWLQRLWYLINRIKIKKNRKIQKEKQNAKTRK